MKKNYIRKSIVLPDIYLKYPHKTYDVTSSTIPYPYFSKDEITEDEYTISYKDWSDLTQDYFKLIRDGMSEGKTFKIPSRLGKISAVKYKRPDYHKSVDWVETNKNNGVITYRKFSDIFRKWAVTFRWRKRDQYFTYNKIWRLELAKRLFKQVGVKVRKDPSILNTIEG